MKRLLLTYLTVGFLQIIVCGHGYAAMYKCIHGGKVLYQDAPCSTVDSGTQITVPSDTNDPLIGCFEFRDLKIGKLTLINVSYANVSESANVEYRVTVQRPTSGKTRLNAYGVTTDSLEQTSELIKMELTDGLISSSSGIYFQLYRGRNQQGKMLYVLNSSDNEVTPIEKVSCSNWPDKKTISTDE